MTVEPTSDKPRLLHDNEVCARRHRLDDAEFSMSCAVGCACVCHRQPEAPGCASCSWSDNGCLHCRPDVSVFDRMAADDTHEAGIEQRAAEAMGALEAVLADPDGPEAIERLVTLDEARIRLQAVLRPDLWPWAQTEALRRAAALMDAGTEASAAALGALRSIIRDATYGEVR